MSLHKADSYGVATYFKDKEVFLNKVHKLTWSASEIDEIVNETLLFAYNISTKEMQTELDMNPNFKNFRLGKIPYLLEMLSYESRIADLTKETVVQVFFYGSLPNNAMNLYFSRAMYLFEREFNCEIDILRHDEEYQSFKKIWD